MSKDAFYKLFVYELQNIYNAENQIVEFLPVLINAASSSDLREVFDHHFEETKSQIKRLKKTFTILGENEGNVFCPAVKGLIQEAKDLLDLGAYTGPVKDAALIGAAQSIEHYEIARYGTLKTFAKDLDYDDIFDLLEKNEMEESDANQTLNDLAIGGFFSAGINQKAMK